MPEDSGHLFSHLFPAPTEPAIPEPAGGAVPVEMRFVPQRRVSGGPVPFQESEELAAAPARPVQEMNDASGAQTENLTQTPFKKEEGVEPKHRPKEPAPAAPVDDPAIRPLTGNVAEPVQSAQPAKPVVLSEPLALGTEENPSSHREADDPEAAPLELPQVRLGPVRTFNRKDETHPNSPGPPPQRESGVRTEAAPEPAPEPERVQPPVVVQAAPESKPAPRPAAVMPAPAREMPPLRPIEKAPDPHTGPAPASVPPAKSEEASASVSTSASDEHSVSPGPAPVIRVQAAPPEPQRLQPKPVADSTPPKPAVSAGVTLRIGRIEIVARPAPVRGMPRVARAPRSHEIEPRGLTGRRH